MATSKLLSFRGLGLGLLLTLAAGLPAASAAPADAALDRANPRVQAVLAAQRSYGGWLMTVPGVVGNATGVVAGEPRLLVFTERALAPGAVPSELSGVAVTQIVTGKIRALKPPPGKGGGHSKSSIDPTARFARPVPIGISTGNSGECSAGTIGARVKSSTGEVFALSNNHVYALENAAPVGSEVLQPGRYDTNCAYDANNSLGTLSAFAWIDFSTSASNVIDAAIAGTTSAELGNATPADGYGTPASTPVDAALNQAVQKYGRTTGLTRGTVIGINATVNITYTSGTARFVDQVVVNARKPFIKAGDSGSLLVTNDGNAAPVGLLFAGDGSGKYGFANPIAPVLQYFQVSVDGK